MGPGPGAWWPSGLGLGLPLGRRGGHLLGCPKVSVGRATPCGGLAAERDQFGGICLLLFIQIWEGRLCKDQRKMVLV